MKQLFRDGVHKKCQPFRQVEPQTEIIPFPAKFYGGKKKNR